jgi:hypothetical protein
MSRPNHDITGCTGEEGTCGPCTARHALMAARSETTNLMISTVEVLDAVVRPTNADYVLFCARMLEHLIRQSPGGLGGARAAMFLAEQNAKLPEGRRFDA